MAKMPNEPKLKGVVMSKEIKITGVAEGRVVIGAHQFNLLEGLSNPPVTKIKDDPKTKASPFLRHLINSKVVVVGVRADTDINNINGNTFVAIVDEEKGGNPVSIGLKWLSQHTRVIKDLESHLSSARSALAATSQAV